ncbi:amidohydrolase [Conexibacter arvalis]|uniref:amidohydrolase n=1 Tax=Conexibacter arvalis TaxID=912552 RepID=UPI001619BA44|nr:amidohydrolase [Conexibacter arvalis]
MALVFGNRPSNNPPVDAFDGIELEIARRIDALAPELEPLLRAIGANPELGFEEHFAASEIARLLEAHGHACTVGLAGMPTALRATAGDGGPHVAILAEYDALPGLGHACGHNVIATIAVGAFLALAASVREGTVELIGCPAEESAVDGAGGKVRLIADGVFDDVDYALMAHPYDRTMVATHGSLAARGVDLLFTGRPTHAVASDDRGVNALDAAVAAYVAIGRLTDQVPSDNRINGIIPEGGDSANVIPGHARLRYRLRAPTVAAVDELLDCVVDCARNVAIAAGCEFETREYVPLYAPIDHDDELVAVARDVMAAAGLEVEPDDVSCSISSTDFGNVTQLTRAVEIGVQLAARGVALHTPEFERAANGAGAIDTALTGAQVLAVTAWRGIFARAGALHG